MNTEKIEIIENAFENINDINSSSSSDIISAIESTCLLYTSPSPRDLSTSRMPSSA